MDVRGPTPGQNLDPNKLSPPQSETLRVEPSGRALPNDHLHRSTASEHQRAPEVVRLTAQLRAIPEVRADVLAAVERRLSDGFYLTRQSAEQTAAAMLKAKN